MKAKLLIPLFLVCTFHMNGQITKAEAFLVGTKMAFYPNQCGNSIPEADGKLTFCDAIDNLGVVERSYGLNDRRVERMLPNHFNGDEYFVTSNGLSIRNMDGTWENIPNISIPTYNSQGDWTNLASIRNGLVLPDGKVIVQASNANYGFNVYDRALKTFTPVNFPNNRFPYLFAYDASRNLTWIIAYGGGANGRYLYTYDGVNVVPVQELVTANLISINLTSVKLIYNDNHLYIGSNNGLFKIDITDYLTSNIITTQYNSATTPSLPYDRTLDLQFDINNDLWLAQSSNNNGDGAVVKFDILNETYETYQLERENNPSINHAFQKLAVDNSGTIWAAAISSSSLYELTFPNNTETWNTTTDAELTTLGVPITYTPNNIYFRNDKFYFTTSDVSSGVNYNFEVIIINNGTWSGRNDNEDGNLSYRMNNRFTGNMPDSSGGVWWFNGYDDIVVYRDADDNHQSILIDNLSFTGVVDDDDKAIVRGGNPNEIRKIDFPDAVSIQDGNYQVNDMKRVADQVWFFDRNNKNIYAYKNDALINTYNLDEDWYENAYYFSADSNADAWFMRNVGGNLEIKKFNTITSISTTYDLSALGSLGDLRRVNAAPNGGVWFAGSLGAVYQENGMFYDFMATDYTEISGLRDLVVDTNGKAYLLNGGSSITTIENPTDANPTLINTSLHNANSILPALDHYLANAIAIDSEGSIWTNASQNTFKLIDDDFAIEYIPQPAVLSINDDELDSELNIYPNPTKNNIHINFKQFGDYSFSVYNISGQEIFHQQQMEVNNTFDFSKYASGIYILKIKDETNNAFKNIKIVKQ